MAHALRELAFFLIRYPCVRSFHKNLCTRYFTVPKPELGRVGERKEQRKEGGGRKKERLWSAILIFFSFHVTSYQEVWRMKYHKTRTLILSPLVLIWLLVGEPVSSPLFRHLKYQRKQWVCRDIKNNQEKYNCWQNILNVQS